MSIKELVLVLFTLWKNVLIYEPNTQIFTLFGAIAVLPCITLFC